MVHDSVDEIIKGSNMDAFMRCTLKETREKRRVRRETSCRVAGHAGKAAIGKLKGT